MVQLYHYLHISHLKSGAKIYLKVSVVFWIFWGGFMSSLLAAQLFNFPESGIMGKLLLVHWNHTLLSRCLELFYLFLLASPGLLILSGKLSTRFLTHKFQGTYSLLAPVDRLTRGVVSLLTAACIVLVWGKFDINISERWIWSLAFGLIFFSLLISIALYGWMSNQFKADQTFDHTEN